MVGILSCSGLLYNVLQLEQRRILMETLTTLKKDHFKRPTHISHKCQIWWNDWMMKCHEISHPKGQRSPSPWVDWGYLLHPKVLIYTFIFYVAMCLHIFAYKFAPFLICIIFTAASCYVQLQCVVSPQPRSWTIDLITEIQRLGRKTQRELDSRE